MATRYVCDICGEDTGARGKIQWRREDVELDSGEEVCLDIRVGTRRVENPDRNYLTGDVCDDCLCKAVAIAFGLYEPCACKPPPAMVNVPAGMDIGTYGAGYAKGWEDRVAQEHDDA